MDANNLTPIEFQKLMSKLIQDRTPAVVLGETTYLVNAGGTVSILGRHGALTVEEYNTFKSWLILKYGDTI